MNRSFLIAVLVTSLTLVSGINSVLSGVANKNEALVIHPHAEIISCIEAEQAPVEVVLSNTVPKDNLVYYLGEKQEEEEKHSILKCLLGHIVFSYIAQPIKITKEELNLSTPSLLAFQSKSQCNLNLHFQVFRI
jgi:archaellum biogenesis protein FlaJ (TadC family)